MTEKTITLGKLTIKGFAALAPMAGVADRSFRELCMNEGAAFCMGELASAKGIAMNDKKSEMFLDVAPGERPMGVQLFGCDVKSMAAAAVAAAEKEPDFIDINMGCPAPKVAGNGSGSALMKNIPLAQSIVAAVKKEVKCPVTVKMRTGWDEGSVNAPELAKACENAGADMITVHGRTRAQGYRPPADLKTIAAVKKAVGVPVIGNGDIFTPQDAARMYEETGCDMIMLGRGCCGRPWIFRIINAYLSDGIRLCEPPVSQRMLILLSQAQNAANEKGEKTAMLQMRKHAAWYIKGLPGAAAMRVRCSELCTLDDLKKLCAEVTLKAQG